MNIWLVVLGATIAVLSAVALLTPVLFKRWVERRNRDLVRRAFSVWAHLGPFENGDESSCAMDCAIAVVRGVEGSVKRETLDQHAEVFDVRRRDWDRVRDSALAHSWSSRLEDVEKAKLMFLRERGMTLALEKGGDSAIRRLFERFGLPVDFDTLLEGVAADTDAPETTSAPARVDEATESQINKLVSFMEDRGRMISWGELYIANGRRPLSGVHAFAVDAGMILIGLRECLLSHNAADVTLLKAVTEAWPSVPSEDDGDLAEMLKTARELASMRQETEGWLANVALVIYGLLHEPDGPSGDRRSHRRFGERAGAMVPDAWNAYAFAKSLFGWELEAMPPWGDR